MSTTKKAKANPFRTLAVLTVGLVAVAVALFGVGLRTAETQTTAPSYYKIQDLGTLGGSHSWASAINDSDQVQVVGYSYLAGDQNYHAFLYKDGKMTDLGTLGGTSSVAKGINISGQVVGWSDNSRGERRAFLYDSANGMQDLNDSIPADLGWTIYEAGGINTDGKIAASSYGNTPPDPSIVCDQYFGLGPPVSAALVLSPTTTADYEVQDLGTLGGYYSRATSINNSSKVAGNSYTYPCGGLRAFFYDKSADPTMQGLSMDEARGLNNSGKVVGYVEELINGSCLNVGSGPDCWRAVLYDSATKQKQYLGDLRSTYPNRGVFGSVANGINDSGDVVGMSGIEDGSYGGDVHAFLKESGQPMIDLNTLIPADSGWTIREATAINNKGMIAATGHKDGVGTHALLLTPPWRPSPPTITSPPDKTTTSDGTPTISGTAEANNTVTIYDGTTNLGTASTDNSGSWTFTPNSALSDGEHSLTATATDAEGNTSRASDSVRITVDKTAPTITSVSPASGARQVARNTDIAATFSEAIDPKTLVTTPTNPSTTFTLVKYKTTTPIIATVSYNDSAKTVTLDPSTNLEARTKYTAKLSGGVRDLAGNTLSEAPYTWSFTTGSQ